MKKILVADDNRDASASLAVLLDLCDYEVRVVADGAQAVDAAWRWRPDLAILDIEMPVMGGLDAARLLRLQLPNLPLVAVTGNADAARRAEAKDAGFDLLYAKPVEFRELRLSVERLLGRRPPAPCPPEPTWPARFSGWLADRAARS